jgi:hypothetical protein
MLDYPNIVHPKTDSLRFILGGKDENRYPAFNGQFTKVVYSDENGAFIDDYEELENYIKKIGCVPALENNAYRRKIIGDDVDV